MDKLQKTLLNAPKIKLPRRTIGLIIDRAGSRNRVRGGGGGGG